jgi:hypothetical protein
MDNFHERPAKKELRGEADDTKGNDDHKKKKDYTADF